jgi:hypothetical protein
LAIAYGVGAIKALNAGKSCHMVAFRPPNLEFVSLTESINSLRTISLESELLKIARSMGICLGEVQ